MSAIRRDSHLLSRSENLHDDIQRNTNLTTSSGRTQRDCETYHHDGDRGNQEIKDKDEPYLDHGHDIVGRLRNV